MTLTNGAGLVPLGPTVTPEVPPVAFPVFRILLALGLVLGVLFGGVWLFRNLPQLLGPKGRTPRLQVLEVRGLGGRHSLFVVGYDGHRFLVGSSPNGLSLIDRLPTEESGVVEPTLGGGSPPPSFLAALTQVLRSR